MRKFIYFSLFKIEHLEHQLEQMEKEGYRLTNVNYSYWFEFKKSQTKEMNYFVSYKSFRGPSMVNCDYALESEHNAHKIDGKLCYYTVYRVKGDKNKLSLLYDVRMDYIKRILLEKMITALCLVLIFLFFLFATIVTSNELIPRLFLLSFVLTSVFFAIYYFYAYYQQRKKCKERERALKECTGDGSSVSNEFNN